jgi:hypothetical protein
MEKGGRKAKPLVGMSIHRVTAWRAGMEVGMIYRQRIKAGWIGSRES